MNFGFYYDSSQVTYMKKWDLFEKDPTQSCALKAFCVRMY